MSTRLRYRWATLGLAWCIFPIGCTGSGKDQLPRQPVWGKVTLDEKPLKRGSITFTPENPQRADAVSAGAIVSEGGYTIPKDGGPTPGKYRVAILDDEETPPPSDEPPGPRPKRSATRKPLVPDKYNAKTTLTAEVKDGESKPIDFELKTR